MVGGLGARRPQTGKNINPALKIGVWGVKTYSILFWKYPARGENVSFAVILTARRDKSLLTKRGLCRYALNESKHDVRRLEFSAGLGGLPPNQTIQNRTRTKNRHKPGKTPASACGGRA